MRCTSGFDFWRCTSRGNVYILRRTERNVFQRLNRIGKTPSQDAFQHHQRVAAISLIELVVNQLLQSFGRQCRKPVLSDGGLDVQPDFLIIVIDCAWLAVVLTIVSN